MLSKSDFKTAAFPLDHLALKGDPAAVALKTRSSSLSFKTLNHRIGLLASWLKSQGLANGARIAAWLPKTELACILPLAAARAGLVYVPVNPLLKRPQVEHIVGDCGASLLIANKGRLRSLPEHPFNGECPVWDEDAVTEALEEQSEPMPPSADDRDLDALVEILYTSGSTGRPKGVMLSHANLTLGAVSVAQYLELDAEDRTLCVLPFSFDYGQNQLFSAWQAGSCAIPLDYLMARDVMKACAREQVTTLAAVPPLWVQLVEQEWPDDATAAMRRLTNSGGALTPSLVRQLRGIFGKKTDIYAMYGLTEAFRSTYLDPDLIDENPTSMGKAIPFAEILVAGNGGKLVADGEEGELVHCGPLVAQGYWNDPDRTAVRFRPAPEQSEYGGTAVWSGDKVRRDSEGFLYFVGRDDLMIKSSGNRISPSEIEEVAIASGLAAEAVAMGVDDERLGQAIRLFVRPSGNTADHAEQHAALEGYLKQNLPNFMHPRDIILLDVFPKNPNGKLDRNTLMEFEPE